MSQTSPEVAATRRAIKSSRPRAEDQQQADDELVRRRRRPLSKKRREDDDAEWKTSRGAKRDQ